MTTHPLTSVAQCRTMDTVVKQHERRAMNEQELVSLLRAHRWTYRPKARRKTGKKYIYAVQWRNTGVIERYIAPLSKLDELTEDFIINKLQQQGNDPNVVAATECYTPTKDCHSVA